MNLSSEQKQFIHQHQNDDIRNLALQFSREDMPFLLAQIKGRQIAKHKIPTWYENDDVIYPPHLSMEQSSSEKTAQYKASLLPKGRGKFVDISGGLGVDFYFMSQHFKQAVYVEQNVELCEIAQHNFNVLGLKNITIVNEKSEDFLQQTPKIDVIFADPARRSDTGRKVFNIEDCSPNVVEIKNISLGKSDLVMIKYSPMLDISLAMKTLDNVREVHIVSVENECKELLFLLSKNSIGCLYHAINIRKNNKIETFSFRPEDEQQIIPEFISHLENYLYESNASILKAGGFNSISNAFQIKKLHKNSHLYTSNELISDFPGRIFNIKNVFSPNKKNIRQLLSETKKANISVRNFPMSVDEIRKKTGLKEGGDVYLFATTLSNEEKVWVVCEKITTFVPTFQ
ncbi:MAG: class I SAM-dependent methyltransferase [Dysgonamonadaceae bacterium]|nr:class I SAM-dependent methyltransferase [Dysgonamonadaceae bacterium]